MINHIKIQNFRSFVQAEVDLQPFSLVVGANGSGKTNFFKFLKLSFNRGLEGLGTSGWTTHEAASEVAFGFSMTDNQGHFREASFSIKDGVEVDNITGDYASSGTVQIFQLSAEAISAAEEIVPQAWVNDTGAGTAQVLESLKSGDREDLFEAIECNFKKYVPEVQKLSLLTVAQGKKQIQVREKGLPSPLPATELSEGTRIILALLTIVHQENPPSMILLEDIDRGLHPRLFEYLAPLLRDIAIKHDINIVATTHNPYLVDAMQDHKNAVIIVEKKDGASTLSTLASRLEGLDYDKVDPDDLPLGQLWFSGLVGGVPKSLSSRAAK